VVHSLYGLLAPLAPPLCFGCRSHAGPGAHPLCSRCRAALAWLGPDPLRLQDGGDELVAWAPLAYRGAAAALVRALKFRGAVALARTMAAQIAANAPSGLLDAGATLVPVPLHPSHRRRRGFNQAERLAGAIAELTGAPVADVLVRAGERTTQVGRGRGDRRRATAGAIRVRRRAKPPPAAVLVDDVVTTGATVRACAAALRSAGSADVAAVTYARTPGR
jgi:ComF family protein